MTGQTSPSVTDVALLYIEYDYIKNISMKIKHVHQTCNKDHGKQGEQLLKSGDHSASSEQTYYATYDTYFYFFCLYDMKIVMHVLRPLVHLMYDIYTNDSFPDGVYGCL